VLDVAALIGARVELDLLTSVTECLPAAVDEILASGLLAEDGGWLRFRYEIARRWNRRSRRTAAPPSTPGSWMLFVR
jgi:hypothetical protein